LGEGANRIGCCERAEERKEGELGGREFQKEGDPKAEGCVGYPRFTGTAVAGGLYFCGEDCGESGEGGAEMILGRGERGEDGDSVTEGVWGGLVVGWTDGAGGREKEVDVCGLERVGQKGGFRGRNCRRS
jgi:hypothetical protein